VKPSYLAFLGRIAPEKRIDRAIRIAEQCGITLKVAANSTGTIDAYFSNGGAVSIDGALQFNTLSNSNGGLISVNDNGVLRAPGNGFAGSMAGIIRLATLGNAFHRAALVRDPIKIVQIAAIKSPGVTEFEAANYARNPTLGEDVIRHIANRREWTKLYGIKFALCRNPKTPITDAMRMLPFLRDKDIERLIKSKGIASAVVAQARKLMMQRRGGAKK